MTPTNTAADSVTAILFEHEDGRYAINPNTTGDPAWHRLGPVDVSALATPAQAVPAPGAPSDDVRSVYSRSMDLVRTFWQQHTQSDALSMTMAELHDDVELAIRVSRGAAQEPNAATWQPIATAPIDGKKILLRSKRGRIADGIWSAANSSAGFWAWAYVCQEPVEWMPLPLLVANAALGAAQAAPADLLRVADRILCDAYAAGMNGEDFDMLAAKAKVAAIFSGAQAAPVDAAVQRDTERPFPAIIDGLLWLCVKEHGAIKPLDGASALPVPRSWKSSMFDAARAAQKGDAA